MKKVLIFLFLISICFLAGGVLAANQIDINTASLQQLDEIIGVGSAIGQKIIDSRPFSSVDDLLRVSGIGEKTLQKIKEQGLACVGCKPTQEEIYPVIRQGTPSNDGVNPNTQSTNFEQSDLQNTEKSDISNKVEAEKLTASISQSQPANPWFLFFTVLATTIILAATVLIIKFKFLKNDVRT